VRRPSNVDMMVDINSCGITGRGMKLMGMSLPFVGRSKVEKGRTGNVVRPYAHKQVEIGL